MAWVCLLACVALGASSARAEEPTASLRAAALPPGWIEDVTDHPAEVVEGISIKLGFPLKRVTVRDVKIHGLRVPINIVTTQHAKDVVPLFNKLVAMRGADFVRHRGGEVIETATSSPIAACRVFHWLAFAPTRKTYTIDMRLALVAKHDYMHANFVFNHFVQLDDGRRKTHEGHIRNYTQPWTFGKSVSLFAGQGRERATFTYEPKPEVEIKIQDEVDPSFSAPPTMFGVPYADIHAVVPTVDRFAPTPGPATGSLLGTHWWPATDLAIRRQARLIVGDAKTPRERLRRIAQFVFSKIRFGGQTGSRYGVKQCMQQGFGQCWDQSDVLITLCRAVGLPARQLAGWVPALKSGHVWAEIHLANEGWLPVDPTTPWLGTSHHYVPFFRTHDGDMPIVHMRMPTISVK